MHKLGLSSRSFVLASIFASGSALFGCSGTGDELLDLDAVGETGGRALLDGAGGSAELGSGGADSGAGGSASGGSDAGSGGSDAGSGGSDAGSGGSDAGSGGSDAGSGGSGNVEPQADPCEESDWSCVPREPTGSYGTMSLDVPAEQNWVNTGLFLKSGQTATVTITGGSWVVANTGNSVSHGSCLVGDMVARIGLKYEDTALKCVSGTTQVTADKDGILFLGAIVGNDGGEPYEVRRNASGTKTVTVTSQGATVPTVQAVDAADYPFDTVASGWVEIWGEHVILTLPTATAIMDAATIKAATDRLDAIYDLHYELRGALPHRGQRLRFYPDETTPGYMLAGNPIRMKNALVTGNDATRISRAGEAGTGVWGFAHEMGHDFTFINGFWAYQQPSVEFWPNVFSMHAFEKLGLTPSDSISFCNSSTVVAYSKPWSVWESLCFLMQFKYDYGWDFYKAFFRDINVNQNMSYYSNWETTAWRFVHTRMEASTGKDVTPEFDAWGVAHP